MECVDFDRHFHDYAEKWAAENRSRFRNADQMEAMMPEVYLRWLNAPADWLDGATPGGWFSQYSDPDVLLSMLNTYWAQRVAVPDRLLERIVDLGEASVDGLMKLAGDAGANGEMRMTALNLLIEIGSTRPMALCIDLVLSGSARGEIAEVAVELLANIGSRAVLPILERMDTASNEAREAFLDILCNFPGDERIYTYTTNAFTRTTEKRALYASYLGKLGDPRAIEPLTRALQLTELDYLDYVEIANAIEALGGEVTVTREFAGDPYYESLKEMR